MNIKANVTGNACPEMRKMSYNNKTSGGYTSIKKKKKQDCSANIHKYVGKCKETGTQTQ